MRGKTRSQVITASMQYVVVVHHQSSLLICIVVMINDLSLVFLFGFPPPDSYDTVRLGQHEQHIELAITRCILLNVDMLVLPYCLSSHA